MAFTNQVAPVPLMSLLVLRPLFTISCRGSGVPGGLFAPFLALGALLGGVLGIAWSLVWPGVPPGLYAVLGAAAVLARPPTVPFPPRLRRERSIAVRSMMPV